MSCIYELLKFSKWTQKNIFKVKAPILLMHAKEDDLTSPKSAEFVYKNIGSSIRKYIRLENSYHLVVMDNERDFVFEKSIEFLNSLSAYGPKETGLKNFDDMFEESVGV